jgi:hypothetical protein
LAPDVTTNPPVANVDIATTKINTAVVLKTLANDAAGNVGNSLVPSSVTVTVAPLHGTTSINPATGDNTYTPATGYTGYDTLTYSVCDNQSPAKCATAKQVITIRLATATNTTVAADDYAITPINTVVSGNVQTNDSDPEGNTQSVTVQNSVLIPGKGNISIAANGQYTFVPLPGYTGPVDIPYTTCDNGIPQACASATLHILVRPNVPGSIGDFVWYDLNRDGLQDVGEPGVPGVIVTLYNAANQVAGSAVTDGNGAYLISNVPPGTGYYVVFSNKPDATAPWTLQNVGGVAANNNSKADASGQTASFDVAEGQNITNMDAGVFLIVNISGHVWHDENGMTDNLVNQSNTTVPIPVGLRVYLINNTTGLVERVANIPPGTGVFTFSNVQIFTNYYLILSGNAGFVGATPPAARVPNWINTGEKLGLGFGQDGIIDGRLNVPVATSSRDNANFGIKSGTGNSKQ